MEYAPVCASTLSGDIEINRTFGNDCVMNADVNATYLYDGECTTEVAPPLTTGTEFEQAHAWMYANGLTSYETEE
ncbi:hypothetical protein KKG31_06760 [Patescibacteria group bacterium]|nr:hypothetical protein [Patescibacteria group bacterium]MBU1758791.1 hypothetical protein [Patescibacteria group bacterium]